MARKRDRRNQERLRRERLRRTESKTTDPAAGLRQLVESAETEARRLARACLRRQESPTRIHDLADGVRTLALRVMEQSPAHGRHECRAGCAFCCHTAVTVAAPETFAIAAYLHAHCSDGEMHQVRANLDANAALATAISREEYIARLVPCALMTPDGNCRAHPVRPMACAGFLSTSRARCEAEFKRVPGRDAVPVDRFAMAAGLAASNGLQQACKDARLDGQFYELHHALRRVLDTPDAADRWARGEDVFDGCLR